MQLDDEQIRDRVLQLLREVGIVEVGRRASMAQGGSGKDHTNAMMFGRVIRHWAENRGMRNNGRRLAEMALSYEGAPV